jgi:hypothetical protein
MGYIFSCTKTVVLFLLVVNVQAQTKSYTEQQKINHLICFIGNMPDAIFIRNGDEHTAKAAAEHLQMKYKKAGKRVQTAEEFIKHIASRSSLTNEPYAIRLKSGRTYDCEFILRAELTRLASGGTELCNPKE